MYKPYYIDYKPCDKFILPTAFVSNNTYTGIHDLVWPKIYITFKIFCVSS